MGDTIEIPEVPTRNGYVFLGWSADKAAIDVEPGGSYTITGASVTLYAIWGSA